VLRRTVCEIATYVVSFCSALAIDLIKRFMKCAHCGRRIRGLRGRRLMRRRGELIERSFAHLYDTGGMRRTPPARSHEHPQAAADPCRRVQSRPAAARDPRGGDAAWFPGPRRPRCRRSFRPDPHRPRTAYRQSRHLVLSFGVAPFELLVFALTLCRHRNRDLRHGLWNSSHPTDGKPFGANAKIVGCTRLPPPFGRS
jgi:hypothetical protein